MPLARIITLHPQDATELSDYFRRLGYDVQTVMPTDLPGVAADIEMSLERLPVEAALRRAAELAEAAGADVHIAPGALPAMPFTRDAGEAHSPEPRLENAGLDVELNPPIEHEPPRPHYSDHPMGFDAEAAPGAPSAAHESVPEAPRAGFSFGGWVREEPASEPAQRSVWMEALHNAAAIAREFFGEVRDEVAESLAAAKQRFAKPDPPQGPETPLEEDFYPAPHEPSRLARWNAALAERRVAMQERRAREREEARLRREDEERERLRQLALRRERQAAEQAERERLEQERQQQLALARQREDAERHAQQEAEQRRRQEAERLREADEAARAQQRPSAIPQPAAMPPARPAAPFGPMTHAPVAAASTPANPQAWTAPQPRAVSPQYARRREDAVGYWRGAFVGAAAVAIVLIVAWATLGTPTPSASINNNGQMKQDVPFGPVTISPKAAAPAAVAPVVATPAPEKPAAQPVAAQRPAPAASAPPRPSPAIASKSRARRHPRVYADDTADDVVVRHYGAAAPKPAYPASARNTGPRRITDQ